ncbi:MAG: cysteine-rich CWC family protein [Burkholderiaceae bacterium]|nr:cysteine-rich CWC family protein [Burkholderiaceae bacterium]
MTAPDPARCPLCGQPNGCAMQTAKATGQPQPPCWCAQVQIDHATLAALPPQAIGRACLCRACATGARRTEAG